MLDRLPEIIDPFVFAERRIELKGKFKLKSLERIKDLLLEDSGEVDVELNFNKQGRHSFIEGTVKAVLAMQCQNCLDTVNVNVDAQVKLGLITALEQADRLPAGYEPLLVVNEEKVLLKEIIEDELLLALPTFPKHAEPCLKYEFNTPDNSADSDLLIVNKPKNPFAVLAKLKPTGEN